MRRLYSTFAGGWPGIGLLLMRLVVGAVLLWHAGPRLWSDPPLHMIAAYALAGAGGAPSHRGVMDATRWSGGRRCRDLRDPHDGRTSDWAPASSHHRRRADDARTRPVVDRRPALRMEAHRSTPAEKSLERALSAEFSTRLEPAGSSRTCGPPAPAPTCGSGLPQKVRIPTSRRTRARASAAVAFSHRRSATGCRAPRPCLCPPCSTP